MGQVLQKVVPTLPRKIITYLASVLFLSGLVSFPCSFIAIEMFIAYLDDNVAKAKSLAPLVALIFPHLLCPFHLTN